MKTTIKIETERLIEAVRNNKGIYVVCPHCNRGAMQYGYDGTSSWLCTWRNCLNRFTEIPSVQEIKELIHLKTQLKQIKDWKI